MLKNLDPLLTADLLFVLASMGHGDEIVIADANFPSATLAKRLVRMAGADLPAMARALLTVLPIDQGEAVTIMRPAPTIDPSTLGTTGLDAILETACGHTVPIQAIDRHDFYARAGRAFAIVATGEQRLYGNVLLTMGALSPASRRS